MVVDDEECILAALAEYFACRGYAVHRARDGAMAQALFERHRHDVVITDLCLSPDGGLEGFALLERVRELESGTACIVLTGQASADGGSHARSRGADAWLLKPVPLAEVARVVERLVGR